MKEEMGWREYQMSPKKNGELELENTGRSKNIVKCHTTLTNDIFHITLVFLIS